MASQETCVVTGLLSVNVDVSNVSDWSTRMSEENNSYSCTFCTGHLKINLVENMT